MRAEQEVRGNDVIIVNQTHGKMQIYAGEDGEGHVDKNTKRGRGEN